MTTLVGWVRAAANAVARLFGRGKAPAQDRKARRQQTDQRLRRDAHRRNSEGERT
jgi:hypothetical protein